MTGGPSNTVVNAMTVFNDGTGPALYAAGTFGFAGGVAANSIAKWNGSAWSALGSGIAGAVAALAVYNDGTGPALYAGGIFTTAGNVPCLGMAKWNGLFWSQPFAVGPASPNPVVYALRVFDDATGPKLYVAGGFSQAGGIPASNIARWNGTSIEALGPGLQSGPGQFGQAGLPSRFTTRAPDRRFSWAAPSRRLEASRPA